MLLIVYTKKTNYVIMTLLILIVYLTMKSNIVILYSEYTINLFLTMNVFIKYYSVWKYS